MTEAARSSLARRWAHWFAARNIAVGDEAGFTLVEVIVALAMLSAGLALVLSMISNGLGWTASAQQMAEAGSLAQSLMARVGTELAIQPGEHAGELADGYRWRLTLAPYGEVRQGDDSPIALYAVSTEVAWTEHDMPRSYSLTSLRLGPKGARR
jgi:general secretion pathway protein I